MSSGKEMMSRFEDFWNEWPSNGKAPFLEYVRKKNRAGCEKKWKQLKLDEKADEIIRNVQQRKRYDKAWLQQSGAFLCGPLVYLNQRQWEDGDFADVRDKQAKAGGYEAPDLNQVCDWIKQNKKLTEKQITSPWQWVWNGERVVGVHIPDMAPLMFKSFKTEGTHGP